MTLPGELAIFLQVTERKHENGENIMNTSTLATVSCASGRCSHGAKHGEATASPRGNERGNERGNGAAFVQIMRLTVRRMARNPLARVALAFLAVFVWGVCAEQIARADASDGVEGREIVTFTSHAARTVAPAVAKVSHVQVCSGDMTACAPAKALVVAPVHVAH